jgi:hypothetical protein
MLASDVGLPREMVLNRQERQGHKPGPKPFSNAGEVHKNSQIHWRNRQERKERQENGWSEACAPLRVNLVSDESDRVWRISHGRSV